MLSILRLFSYVSIKCNSFSGLECQCIPFPPKIFMKVLGNTLTGQVCNYNFVYLQYKHNVQMAKREL